MLFEVQGQLFSCHADNKPQQKKYTRTDPVKTKTYTAVEGQS